MSIYRWQKSLVALAIVSGLTAADAANADYPQEGALTDPVPVEAITPVIIEDEASGELPPPSASDLAIGGMAVSDSPAVACGCCETVCCCTKKKKEAATAAMKGAFKGVFYDNNFSYLNDPCYDGPSFLGDCLKGLRCNTLDIGGEARVRYHSETNLRGLAPTGGIGLTTNDDDFWLTRYRMYADWQMTDIFRFYGEFLYADSGGGTFGARGIEENRGEAQNLFIDVKLFDGPRGELTGRFGRQELLYGAQRLISPLDWANTRRTFDGYKFLYSRDDVKIDGFYVNPVRRDVENWDPTNQNVDFYGVWGTKSKTRFGAIDAYYLGLNNNALNFNYQTLGSRVTGETERGLLYAMQGGVQFGENSDGSDHGAGFFTGGLGRKLRICTKCGEWNPIIWFWYDWASGEDDFADVARGDDGFDQLFPLAHKYLGFMDLYGRRNINDANVQFITPIMGNKVKLLLWYHYLFLDEKTTPYSVVMTPYNTATPAGDRELGHEIDVLFNIAVNPRNSVLLGYSHFDSGKYYSRTAGVPNVDADFFYFQYQMRF